MAGALDGQSFDLRLWSPIRSHKVVSSGAGIIENKKYDAKWTLSNMSEQGGPDLPCSASTCPHHCGHLRNMRRKVTSAESTGNWNYRKHVTLRAYAREKHEALETVLKKGEKGSRL